MTLFLVWYEVSITNVGKEENNTELRASVMDIHSHESF